MRNPLTMLFKRGEKKSDPNYAQYGTRVTMLGSDGPIYAPRNYQTFAREGYARSVVAHRCIEMCATAASGIPLHLYSKRGKHLKELDEHPLLDRLANPGAGRTGQRVIHDLVAFQKLDGNAYLYANRLKSNPEPQELWTLRPDRVSINPARTGVQSYVYNVNGYKQTFQAADVMHWDHFNPLDDHYGLSEVEVAFRIITQQNAGDDRNTALLQNAARPSGGLFAKEVLNDPEFERLNNQIIDEYSGTHAAGVPLFFDGDMKWQPMGLTPMELDWLKSRVANNRDICIALGVPSMLLGDVEARTYANYETALLAFYTETILPMMDQLCALLTLWLCPMYGDDLCIGYNRADIEVLQENQEGVSARATAEFNNGGITLNEYRLSVGQDEDPGGDIYKFQAGPTILLIPRARLGEYANAIADQAITAAKVAKLALEQPPAPPPTTDPTLPPGQNPPKQLPPGQGQNSENTEAMKAMIQIALAALEYKHAEHRVPPISVQPERTLVAAGHFDEHYARFKEGE